MNTLSNYIISLDTPELIHCHRFHSSKTVKQLANQQGETHANCQALGEDKYLTNEQCVKQPNTKVWY